MDLLALVKRYRITKHIYEGYILDYRRTIFSNWERLLIFTSKHEALNGIERHKNIKPSYH